MLAVESLRDKRIGEVADILPKLVRCLVRVLPCARAARAPVPRAAVAPMDDVESLPVLLSSRLSAGRRAVFDAALCSRSEPVRARWGHTVGHEVEHSFGRVRWRRGSE